jgi:hypothetical protein
MSRPGQYLKRWSIFVRVKGIKHIKKHNICWERQGMPGPKLDFHANSLNAEMLWVLWAHPPIHQRDSRLFAKVWHAGHNRCLFKQAKQNTTSAVSIVSSHPMLEVHVELFGNHPEGELGVVVECCREFWKRVHCSVLMPQCFKAAELASWFHDDWDWTSAEKHIGFMEPSLLSICSCHVLNCYPPPSTTYWMIIILCLIMWSQPTWPIRHISTHDLVRGKPSSRFYRIPYIH